MLKEKQFVEINHSYLRKNGGGQMADFSITLAIASVMTLGYFIFTMIWNTDF